MSFNKKFALVLICALLPLCSVFSQTITKFAVVDTSRVFSTYYRDSSAVRNYEAKKAEFQKIVTTKTEEPEIKDKYGEFELVIFSKWANNTVDKQYMAVWTRLGLEVHMGYHNGYTFARGEELAEFEDYINRLCDDGLIKYDKTNDKGIKIYSITKKGYDFAHTLPMYDDNNNLIHR